MQYILHNSDKVLSMEMNDLFMRRVLQLLPMEKVRMLMQYLIHLLKMHECQQYKQKVNLSPSHEMISVEAILNWLTILLDAHLYQLSFESEPWLLTEQLQLIRSLLENYDKYIDQIIIIQANLHHILSISHINGDKFPVEKNSVAQKEKVDQNHDYFVEEILL
ncbi:hypothetical protein RFI_16061 [Reticulomyxa filosa]|uniref:Nucleolar protein 11 C-terminal domain-containing protein n=1 Tax=Reticulomyxa filosa TaxID=46433 RepID=X6N5C4_RETFI|nr:hypothetical protein RFI_16061 [Reticulomyxa filosa]|eukprot:ETO21143.1 hypothetical protein RFI_16061 [Reticulomyxa filosa]